MAGRKQSDGSSRRDFLSAAAVGGASAAIGDLAFLSKLRPVSADEVKLDPKFVHFDSEIEPVVRLLEETPRDRVIEVFGEKVRKGATYREVMTAIELAGIRNIQPRPSVGFKFHAVLVINSAHLASLHSPPEDRWLPVFWAIDSFKSSQAKDVAEGDWTMSAVDESRVPKDAEKARAAFIAAMDSWDEAGADIAATGMARTAKPKEIFELLYRYGARGFRDIGHLAIYTANTERLLDVIGTRYLEPIVRSLAYALLAHNNEPNPSKSELPADAPWRRNQPLADKIRKGWTEGKHDSAATKELLATLRTGSGEEACNQAVEMLNRSVDPKSIWDAVFAAAGELGMRKANIISLHAVTSTNAYHYAFGKTSDDTTRRLMLLQNLAFLPMFRDRTADRGGGKLPDVKIDHIEPLEAKDSAKALDEIFALVGKDPQGAARRTLAYLVAGGPPKAFVDAARRLIYLKGNDAHDYKYSCAILEDAMQASEPWRNAYLASSVYFLSGSGQADNPLIKRTRAALG